MISKRLLSTPVIMAGLAIVLPALAQTTGLDNPLGTVVDPRVVIGNVIRAMLGIVGSLALAVFIFGGFNWVIAAGNEEKIKKAVHTIRYSIIGLFVSFIAFFIVSFLARLLDIPFELSFSTIIDLMTQIFDSLK